MHIVGFFAKMNEIEIKKSIESDGFKPLIISNEAGDIYPKHSHIETKLLAFLDGSMDIEVEGKHFLCYRGDKIVIPGGQIHSAVVGKDGCRFFWAEKII